jgi:hypothetical protein
MLVDPIFRFLLSLQLVFLSSHRLDPFSPSARFKLLLSYAKGNLLSLSLFFLARAIIGPA